MRRSSPSSSLSSREINRVYRRNIRKPTRMKRKFVGSIFLLGFAVMVFILRVRESNRIEEVFESYTSSQIAAICTVLPIISQQDFCVSPSLQDARRLDRAISSVFPLETTNYSQIMDAMSKTLSRWTVSSETCKTSDYQIDKQGNCPLPNFCSEVSEYHCSFSIVADIPKVYVDFDMRTGSLLRIYVPTPGDS
jgi:hypothetical protein